MIEAEPGRRLGAFSLGPRVIVALPDLEQTGLLAFGSRATYQRLARVPDPALAGLTSRLRADLANSFVRVRAYTATEDDMGEDFARAENYLSLVGLVVVILGGVGVSSVTRVFVQQKLKSIAVLKCLGARSSQVLAVYIAQVLALGVLGSVVGVAIAAAVMAMIPRWLSPAMTQGLIIDYSLTPSALAQGVGTGLLVSLLFALVPLLDVRYVKPSQLLREETDRAAARLGAMGGDGRCRRQPGRADHVAGRVGTDRRHRRRRLRRARRGALLCRPGPDCRGPAARRAAAGSRSATPRCSSPGPAGRCTSCC